MKKYIITIILITGITVITFAQKMGELTLIKAGDEVIDCSPPYAGPTIYDFDKDGLQDLVVGTFAGQFRFYKNCGTKDKPVYNGFELIQADGVAAKIPNW